MKQVIQGSDTENEQEKPKDNVNSKEVIQTNNRRNLSSNGVSIYMKLKTMLAIYYEYMDRILHLTESVNDRTTFIETIFGQV
ncbi:MAG: hypothetical protein IPH77_00805 [Ignavibacteria bacterium]|nr:hypothetical protein [Ignavibacteria bacterium]